MMKLTDQQIREQTAAKFAAYGAAVLMLNWWIISTRLWWL